MRVVFDIEANELVNPTEVWVIVCKDIDTGKLEVFRNVTSNPEEKTRFQEYASKVTLWIGHNCLGYDFPVLRDLSIYVVPDVASVSIDTFVVSKMADYGRKGHSIESYGIEFNFKKGDSYDPDFFKRWSLELETYCIRDVDICHRVYERYHRYIRDCHTGIHLEQSFQLIVNDLHDNGFALNVPKVKKLLTHVEEELHALDQAIQSAFPPKLRPVREIHPRLTQHGTLKKSDFRWVVSGDLSEFNGGPFTRCSWVEFNASSPRQIVDVLNKAGWTPYVKTDTHNDVEREIARAKYSKEKEVDISKLKDKLQVLSVYGWKVNEENLATLPNTAPSSARTLARRILFESRRRTLTEWLDLVTDDGRVHGKFVGIGAWTRRMAHQEPNMANIPNEFKEDGSIKLLGKELRSCWVASRRRLLAGVDAEGIQLRIFAHYCNDEKLIESIVHGRKSDKSDSHSINQRVLQCKTRQQAKRFLYALFLGGGLGRLGQILEMGREETEEALGRLLKQYPGFDQLRREQIPSDAKRGYFVGLDGSRIPIKGDTPGERRHLAMSGYLQSGEAICMKMATLKWYKELNEKYPGQWKLVDLVHDEWQTEVPNNLDIATDICSIQSAALTKVGEELGLRCPLAGSYYNDDHHDYTIGTNWAVTH